MKKIKRLFKRIFLGKHPYRLANLQDMYCQILSLYGFKGSTDASTLNETSKECISLIHRTLSLKEIQKSMIYTHRPDGSIIKNYKLSLFQIYKILKFELELKNVYRLNNKKYDAVMSELEKLNKPLFKRLFL
jgi:hypothetical protein